MEIIESPDTLTTLVVSEFNPAIHTTEVLSNIVVGETLTTIVSEAAQGIQGPPGIGTAGVFVFDVQAPGVVSGKAYPNEPNILVSCATDSERVTITFGCDGESRFYKPWVRANGVLATITETMTLRWFTGVVDVPLFTGDNLITLVSSAGTQTQVLITRVGAGPEVVSVVWSKYPGTQTELKAGDVIEVTITLEDTAVSCTLVNAQAINSITLPVVSGVARGPVIVSGGTGSLGVTVSGKNSFGTTGAAFTSPALVVNQTKPVFGSFTVVYPPGLSALDSLDQAAVEFTVSEYDQLQSIAYGMEVTELSQLSLLLVCTAAGYVDSGRNLVVIAHRGANDSTTVGGTLVYICTTEPTAQISVLGSPTKLSSSPEGIDYEVSITSDQQVTSPSLLASVGEWQGQWVGSGHLWKRMLRIRDTDPRGTAFFHALDITSMAMVVGHGLVGNVLYTVGGMSSRDLTYPAFSRTTPIGSNVYDPLSTSAQVSGGNPLTLRTDAAFSQNGYYISDSLGNYLPTGGYLALSDSDLAGSNSSGTLKVTFEEVS